MNNDTLRTALAELNGQRDAELHFQEGTPPCYVQNAMLLPAEDDHLVKLTDGKHVFVIDAERLAWLKIG
jgi:hypothetical protein